MSAVLLTLQSALPTQELSVWFKLTQPFLAGGTNYHFIGFFFYFRRVLPASGCCKLFSSCVWFQSCSFAQAERKSFGWCVGMLGAENALMYGPQGKACHLYRGEATYTFVTSFPPQCSGPAFLNAFFGTNNNFGLPTALLSYSNKIWNGNRFTYWDSFFNPLPIWCSRQLALCWLVTNAAQLSLFSLN